MNVMMKKIIISVLLLSFLAACDSPEERAVNYAQEGDQLYQNGEYDKAFLQYRNALQLNSNLDSAWYGVARINIHRQEWRKAFEVLNKIYELNPQNYDARIDLAEILFASNQLDKAVEHVNEIVEMFPDRPRTDALRAVMLYRLGNLDDSLLAVDKVLKEDPNNQKVLLTKAKIYSDQERYNDALKIVDQGIQSSKDKAAFYVLKNFILQKMNADNTAFIALLRELTKAYPENKQYYFTLSKYLAENEQKDEGKAVLLKLLQNNPDDIEAKLGYVDYLREFFSFDQALAELQKFNAQNPSADYQFYLAEYYASVDKLTDAEAAYNKIITEYAGQVSALKAKNKLAVLEYNNKRVDEAKKYIAEVLAAAPKDTEALLLDAQIKLNDDQADDAIIKLRELLREDPENAEALFYLSRSYTRIGSDELALDNMLNAYRLEPRNQRIAFAIANLFYQNGELNRALEILEAQLNGRPSVQVIRLLSQVYLDTQNWEKAQKMVAILRSVEGQESLSEQLNAMILEGKKEFAGSQEAFKDAHKLSPNSVQPIIGLVRVYLRNNEPEKAKSFLKSVIQADQKNMVAYMLLADMARSEQKPDEQFGYLDQLIANNPKEASAYRITALNYIRSKDDDKAFEILQKGIDQADRNLELYMTRASLYENRKQYVLAKQDYEQILKSNPDYLVAKNNLASLLVDRFSDSESLKRAMQLAADLKNTRIDYYLDTYAWTLTKSNQNLQEAISILYRLVEGDNALAVYKYHLATALMEGNQLFRAEALVNDLKEELDRSFSDQASVDALYQEIKKRQGQVSSG